MDCQGTRNSNGNGNGVVADLVDQAELKRLQEQLRHLHAASTEMQPGSWDRTFIRDVFEKGVVTLTENQRNQVKRLAYKYRRQMPKELVPARVQMPAGVRP